MEICIGWYNDGVCVGDAIVWPSINIVKSRVKSRLDIGTGVCADVRNNYPTLEANC